MKIIFFADKSKSNKGVDVELTYSNTKKSIEESSQDLFTTQLCFLSFDLLDYFDEIQLFYKNKFYDLKLGKNTWTYKELRKEHNLFKLVQSYILNE